MGPAAVHRQLTDQAYEQDTGQAQKCVFCWQYPGIEKKIETSNAVCKEVDVPGAVQDDIYQAICR